MSPTPVTPPSSTSPLPQSTPIHTQSNTTHKGDRYGGRVEVFTRLSTEMNQFFVGPMPPQDFLHNFLPVLEPGPPSFSNGMFSDMCESPKEIDMYKKFITIVSPFLENLKIIDTSCKVDAAPYNDFPFECRPDCSVYDCLSDHKEGLNSALVDFFIEFKTRPCQDPFFLDSPSLKKERRAGGPNPLVNTTTTARDVLGQIISYATLLLSSQYRTHAFSVLILKEHARLIRWDRSGAIVTEPIKYNEDSSLFDFLVRYNNAGRAMRGHDPTVDSPTKDEERDARMLDDLAHAKFLLSITIQDPSTLEQRRYIVPGPRPRPSIPAGRWTRTSIAYDVKARGRVLVKDSWRVLLPGIQPEGVVYATLQRHLVPNIPTCLLAGDVGADDYHRSQTDTFTRTCDHPHAEIVTPHRHYRLVLGTIGKNLHEFGSSQQLVKAIRASLQAHQAACKAGILHRDISAGNIMIVDSEENPQGGMLIDWDLSKAIDPEKPDAGRQLTRTGTWLFMAADLVKNPTKPQTAVHDLESFYWVLLWVCIVYMKTSRNLGERSSFVNDTMCPRVYARTGGQAKENHIARPASLSGLKVHGKPAVAMLLKTLHVVLGARYQDKLRESELLPSKISLASDTTQSAEQQVNPSHESLIKHLEEALNMDLWDEDGPAERQEITLSQEESRLSSRPKRSHSTASRSGGFCVLPPAKRSEVA